MTVHENNETGTTTYQLADAILTVPEEWIVLNPEEAKDCRYAGVVECRNSSRYGIPHFVFFSNFKDYTPEFVEAVKR